MVMDVLSRSNTFIFDIDRTLIDTVDCDGNLIWLKNLVLPFRLINTCCIEDAVGSRCVIQEGAREFLNLLGAMEKEIGYLSVGGLLDTSDDKQPSIIVLKMFGMHSMFNGPKILLYKTASKADRLAQLDNCVFFDDDEHHIAAAKKLENVFAINRCEFSTWESLQ
jgi:predicted phosphatase